MNNVLYALLANGFNIHKHHEKEWYYISKAGYTGVVLLSEVNSKLMCDVACKNGNTPHFRNVKIPQGRFSVAKIEELLNHKFRDSGMLSSPREILNIGYLALKPLKLPDLAKNTNKGS